MNTTKRHRARPRVGLLAIVPLAAWLGGCGGGEGDGGTQGADAAAPTAAAERAPAPRRGGGLDEAGECLAGFAERPCELLTEALVRKHVAAAAAEIDQADVAAQLAESGVKLNFRGVAMNGCTYSWEGGRTQSLDMDVGPTSENETSRAVADAMKNMLKDLPKADTVEFRSIQVLEADDPAARFAQKWRAPTAEEREMLARRMEERMDEAREAGELGEAGAEMGKDMGRSLAQADIAFEDVDGVATMARWGGMGDRPSLKVLAGATEFDVIVDVSDDAAENREIAVALAKDLVAECRD